MASVKLKNVSKSFGRVNAVKNLSVYIQNGDFFSILGPSGCGKTTVLRLISGLEDVDDGDVCVGGENITGHRPYERSVNTVFQNYALFPHMTTFENIAFGLRTDKRRIPDNEILRRVSNILELVQLTSQKARMPDQLSGGQQQRVALARALVLEPKVLLLDEPLAALDRKLRIDMQAELRHIQENVGITFIYVTHDQEEAMSLSDQIAVMRDGQFEQIGSPKDIFQTPKTRFVADFMGASNIFGVRILSRSETTLEMETDTGLVLTAENNPALKDEKTLLVSLRPEIIKIFPSDHNLFVQNQFMGTLAEKRYLGDSTEFKIAIDDNNMIISRVPSGVVETFGFKIDDRVKIGWNHGDCNIFADQ